MLSVLSSWLTTVSLIFGGCCSNAITLEQLTSEHPNAGPLVTFFQFLLIALHGLPKFLIWTRFGPRFRPRQIPLLTYFFQVILFYLVSLLNNAAFAYQIPMAVHIIFRSAGLVIMMVLGWLISNKRYTRTQVVSVLLVTSGVIITTFSAQSSPSKSATSVDPYVYAQGIGILTLALVLSGFLGLVQDWAQSKRRKSSPQSISGSEPEPWQESMFYLHFLALPMFLPLFPDLVSQMHHINTNGLRAEYNISIPFKINTTLTSDLPPSYSIPQFPIRLVPQSESPSLLSIIRSFDADAQYPLSLSFSFPRAYLPLVLNTLAQLLCIAGVHRLTTRVSSLTVTLVLVVRKAASLVISMIGLAQTGKAIHSFISLCLSKVLLLFGWDDIEISQDGRRSLIIAGFDVDEMLGGIETFFSGVIPSKGHQGVDRKMMWIGSAIVLLGTLGYTIGSRAKPRLEKGKEKED